MLFDTTYFLRTLKRRAWILISIPLSVGTVIYFVAQDLPKKYKSIAQVSAGLPIKIGTMASNGSMGGYESNTSFLNHVEAMKTGFIGSMVVYNLLLHDLTEDVPFRNNDQRLFTPMEINLAKERLGEKLASFETLSPYNDLENKLIGELRRKDYDVSRWIDEGQLQIERIGDTNFIKVEFLSENPFLSAFVVNTMSTEYIRFNHSLSRSSNDSLQFFSNLVEKRKKELDEKTEQLNQARSGNRNVAEEKTIQSVQLTGYEARLREESGKVNKLRESLRNIKSKISNYKDLAGNVDNTDPRNTRKVAELQARIDKLNKIYTENGAKDESLKATINGLKNQLQNELTRLTLEKEESDKNEMELRRLTNEEKIIESQYKQAELNLLSVRTQVDRLRKDISRMEPGNSDIELLEREFDQASLDYIASKEKLDNERKNRLRVTSGGNGGLKLMVMGQPNAEPESLDPLTLVIIVVSATVVISIITILISTYIRTPRRPTTPTFVITR